MKRRIPKNLNAGQEEIESGASKKLNICRVCHLNLVP
jgi:hypothetical protein